MKASILTAFLMNSPAAPQDRRSYRYRAFICLSFLLVFITTGCRDRLAEQRAAFLLVEKYISERNESGFLSASAGLADYPLYPYLRYQWVKTRLDHSGEIAQFLTEYQATRYAPLLRSQWLDYFAEHHRWPEFLQNYQINERSADDCRWHWASYQAGKQQQALEAAKRLWLKGSVSSECKELFSALTGSSLLAPADKWRRFETTLFQNKTGAAQSAAELLDNTERNTAGDWLRLHARPSLITDKHFWQDKSTQSGRILAHALVKLADADLEKAIKIWELKKQESTFDEQSRQAVERKFGMELLADKNSFAFEWLNKLPAPDEEIRQAKVRAALLEPNWRQVIEAIAGLTMAERREPKARYWLARAREQTGNHQEAQVIYAELAKDRSFYGFLAADLINQPYELTDRPVIPDLELLAQLSEPARLQSLPGV